jgi:hypothetical protein
MATTYPDRSEQQLGSTSETRAGVLRLAVTMGLSAAVVFTLCWLGTFIPASSPTHAYIGFFTRAEPSSGLALAEGTCWSLLFGGLYGATLAIFYNLSSALQPR